MSVSPGVMMASKPHPPLAQEVIRGRPRGHQIRGPPRDQAAQIHVERQEGFSVFCLIQCIPFALCWTVVFLDLCLMIWLNYNLTDKITVAFHKDWYWEALCLGIEAGYALFILCAAGGVIASRLSVLPLYYAWICVSLCAVTGVNLGWMIREFNHGHTPSYQFWKICEVKSLTADLKGYFGGSENKIVPPWMDKIQQNVKCCGIASYEDWYNRFGFLSLPDSCCQHKSDGCGDEFFIKEEEERPSIFITGCGVVPPESSGMSYKIFHLLLLVKTVETFLFALNLVIWLFCLRREHAEIRQQINVPPLPSAPIRMNDQEEHKIIQSTGFSVHYDYDDVDDRLRGDFHIPPPRNFRDGDGPQWNLIPSANIPQLV